jgi:hypothetical protein
MNRAEAARAFGLLYGYEPIAATVTATGIKDTTTGAVTLVAG